jgi:CheY-like chemotaxis protein
MLNALTNLHHSQPLCQDAEQWREPADRLLARSRVSVTRGTARAGASMVDEAPPVRRGGARAPHTTRTILLIDDEPSFVRVLARVLRQHGGTVDTAADGHLALTHLQAQRYDVVLCDLRMPGLDGPAFYNLLCAQHAYLRQRVLFLTGDTLGAASTAFLENCGCTSPVVLRRCGAPCNSCCMRWRPRHENHQHHRLGVSPAEICHQPRRNQGLARRSRRCSLHFSQRVYPRGA